MVNNATSKRINVFLAGDSTMANCPNFEKPMAGWGQLFSEFFTEEVRVYNFAKGGASTNTFIELGHLAIILDFIQPDDYLFIQFGHNDQKSYGTEPYTTYTSNLEKYIIGAREKGANPILLTSVHRRNFNETGELVNSLGDYPKAMIELARKLEVPLINMWEKTEKLYQSLGPEESKKLFVWLEEKEHPNYPNGLQDNTHFCEMGAREIGKHVIKGIKELQLPLLTSIKAID